MSSANPAHVAATTETYFQSFSAVVLKPLLQFISTECLASLPASSLEIADFVIQLLTENKELVNQLCRGSKTSMRLEKSSPPSVPCSKFLLKCKTALSNASNRRDVSFLRNVFNRHKDSSGGLAGQNLIQALQEVDAPNIPASDQEVAEIIQQFDNNSNKTLEFGEFQQVVNEPDELQVWLSEKQLPLAADALRPLVGRGSDQLKKMSQLSFADIELAAAATCAIIPRMLKELHEELRTAFAVQSQIEADMKADPSKFNDFYKIACGTINDFHKGLTGRVGMPHLQFKNAMRQEHCERAGCDVNFSTGNYKITTTPRQEWKYIVENIPCPDMGHERRIISISELLQRGISKQAKLCEEEVIAIVLYTGPMFQIYNTILRQYPEDKFEIFRDGDNLFSTTIFVLVSAVQKLSRFTRIPLGTQLYRGLGGKVDLPDIFFQIDDKGCSGYAEWGFLSTTSDRDVALGYSGVKERRPKAMVMVIETSSIDRGADISEFSQYPGEKEFLYLPCSFVQRTRHRNGHVQVVDGGLVAFFPVKVNLNIKTQTVEELQEQKKSLHMVSAKSILPEVKFELTELVQSCSQQSIDLAQYVGNVGDFIDKIMGMCRQVVESHEGIDAKDFADDDASRRLINELWDAKVNAINAKKWQQFRVQSRGDDFEAATCVATWAGHSKQVGYISFHPTAPLLATGSRDGSVKLWRFSPDGSTTICVDTLSCSPGSGIIFHCFPVAFHPTAPLLATGYASGIVKLWRLSTDNSSATCVATLKGRGYSLVFCVAFHPSAPLLATGSGDKTAKLWRLSSDNSSATCVATLAGHSGSVCSVAFHPTAPLLATGSGTSCSEFSGNNSGSLGNNTVKLWRLSSNNSSATCVATLEGHCDTVTSVAFYPTAPLLATGSGDKTAKLWRLSSDNSSATCVATLAGHSWHVFVAFHPTAPLLASGGGTIVKLWRLSSENSSATLVATLVGHSNNVTSVAFHPTAPLLATGSGDNTVRLWRNVGYSSIFIASRNGRAECLKLLLAAGGDINKCNQDGFSPIYVAAYNGHAECLKLLLGAGGDVNKCSNDGRSPIWAAAKNSHADCLKLLLDAGGDVNKCNNNGASPIYIAAFDGHAECLKLLLAAGGDVNKCNNDGLSPIYTAAIYGYADCITLLLASRADARSSWDGKSALDCARGYKHSECVRVLEAALS
jgi:WD40 repeat protein